MTLAAIDWLSISINLLLVLFVIVCLLMTLLILMQRPKQEGLGAAFGGGVTDQVFGARTTNVLQRGTVYLGSMFFLISLALAVLISAKNKNTTLVTPETTATEEVEVTEEIEVTPAADDEALKPKSLIEELPQDEPAPADAPAEEVSETPAPQADEALAPADTTQDSPAADASAAPTDATESSDGEPVEP